MKVTIDKEILEKTPDFSVGIMTCKVSVYENEDVNDLIKKYEEEIYSEINISEVINLETIKEGRDAYKAYGKDPSRYRLAVESLYRRLSKGNKLYRVNNIVDIGNILSIKLRKSVAVLDYNKIDGDVKIRLGRKSDEYYGIGRGLINIENIPLYEDDISPFGSTTSDTERTMITNKTKRILVFIISFNGKKELINELEYAKDIYMKFGKGINFKINIV